MKILSRLIPLGFKWFCVATVAAQVIVVGVLWIKGGLTEDKRLGILAVLYNVELASLRDTTKVGREPQAVDDQLLLSRATKSSDVTLRRKSFRTSLSSLIAVENEVKAEQRRSGLRETDFDNLLARFQQQVLDASLLEVRRTLEEMNTKQAKSQLMRMLSDEAMDDVVAMVIAMPLDKRKKIFSEFRSTEESERLHEILRQIRQVAELSPEDSGKRKS